MVDVRHPRGRAAAFVVLVGLGLSGCQQASNNADSTKGASVSQTKEAMPAATLAVNVPANATDVRPDTKITVASTRGTLDSVKVTTADGAEVPGTMSGDETSWVAQGPLGTDTEYKVSAAATNPDGESTPLSQNFKTLKPNDIETASITPTKDLGQVGVAMPVVVLFDATPLDKVAVEKRLKLKTSVPVTGSWHWVSDRQVVYRPKDFWKSGTKVDVAADMTGVEFENNIWGVSTDPVHFEVGRNQVSTVDIANHVMTVKRDGKVINTLPVTTGMGRTGKYATRNGMKVIITREYSHRMVAPGQTQDSPEYYDLNVRYAMRLTWSGEFIHAAPWSVGSQGRANVSHGCTGMSTSRARWMMENSLIGDPVNYINGARPITIDNGWAFWNMPYNEWVKGSALYDEKQAAAEAAADKAAAATSTATATLSASDNATSSQSATSSDAGSSTDTSSSTDTVSATATN